MNGIQFKLKINPELGTLNYEFKGKFKESVIKQIKKMVEYTNGEENAKLDIWHRQPKILEVYWETLTLDRKGYQRKF